jgi:hypothetical protein
VAEAAARPAAADMDIDADQNVVTIKVSDDINYG